MRLRVYALANQANGLEGAAAVVIDVLRMTTTASAAIQAGCAGIRAVAEVEKARSLARETGALLGGERGGVKLEGFDFGNSPLEYAPERVAGRRIVLTTSNGTGAVQAAMGARRVLLGAFVNASAAARALMGEDDICLLCAGTKGEFSLDDALCAGALAWRLAAREENDLARAMRLLYEAHREDITACVSGAYHYKYLARMGFQADLAACLREDTCAQAPELAPDGWFYA